MDWAVLPVPGGVYDQDPRLVDQWETIMTIEAHVESQKNRTGRNKAKRV